MDCDRCGREAVMRAAYSGAHLCGDHLRASVEKRIRRRIREDGLLPADASPENPQTWVVGLSGGKDSAVLTHVLAETFDRDPRVELVALSVHEGSRATATRASTPASG
jgi:tRNA(Ile)-lysidine synthase TilS/MesJ